MAHLLSALHQNAAAVVNSKSQLNGPDQVLISDSFSTTRRNESVKVRHEDQGLGSEEPISIPTMFRDIYEAYPDTVALRAKREGKLKEWTYEQYYEEVRLVARAFIHLGLHRHHSVAIMGSNSPESVIANLGAIFAGGISMGLQRQLCSDDIAKIAIDAKADIIVVENEAILKRILLIQHKLPELRAIIQIQGEPSLSDKRRLHRTHKKHILSWSQALDIGKETNEGHLDDRLIRVAINQCCTLVYTSGTSGCPKGIMLSHDNLTWSSKMLLGVLRAPGFNRLPSPGEEIILSLLPASSVTAHILDIYYTMSIAGTLCFYDEDILNDMSSFFDAVASVQPTVFCASPHIYERIYQRFRENRRQMSGFQKLFLDWSSSTVRMKHVRGRIPNQTANSGILNQWQTAMAKNTVCKKHKEALGFQARTVFLSIGEPMCKEILTFLAGYDIVIHEMYGYPETCGLLSANIPKRYCKLGTSGKAVPGVKLKLIPTQVVQPLIDDDHTEAGEIATWGRHIFMGYLNRDGDTKDCLTSDDWLKFGVAGLMDTDDFLLVQGKPADWIRLKSGELIAPQRIEQLVRLELPAVQHVVLVGNGENHLAALLTLQTKIDEVSQTPTKELSEEAKRWCRHAKYDLHFVSEVVEKLELGLQHAFQAGIDRANLGASSLSHTIGDWRLVPEPFKYQTGELGLGMELIRAKVMENNITCIRSLFVHEGTVCSNDQSNLLQIQVTLSPQLSQVFLNAFLSI